MMLRTNPLPQYNFTNCRKNNKSTYHNPKNTHGNNQEYEKAVELREKIREIQNGK